MSYISSCDRCDTAMPQNAHPNYVTVDGDLRTLCGECLRRERKEAYSCGLCGCVAETTYDFEDFVEKTLPVSRSAWYWGDIQVCPRCVRGR